MRLEKKTRTPLGCSQDVRTGIVEVNRSENQNIPPLLSLIRSMKHSSKQGLTPFIASEGDGAGSADGGVGGGGLAGKSLTDVADRVCC